MKTVRKTSYQAAPELEHVLRAAELAGNSLDVMTPESVLEIRRFREEEARHFLQTIHLLAVRDLKIPASGREIPLRIYAPEAAHVESLPILLFMHGGGWTLGSLQTHDNIARAMASKTPAIVVAVDYRLAPEHPFPAGIEDAFHALNWVVENAPALGGEASRIGVVGDSAGANIGTAVARRAHRAGIPVAFQAMFYPSTDLSSFATASHAEFGSGYLLTNESLRRFRDFYVPDPAHWTHPEVSPLLARDEDFAILPPSLIAVAGCDPLREEGIAFAHRLAANGVPVQLRVYDNMIHGFLRYFNTDPKVSPVVEAILENLAREIAEAFATEAAI